MMGFGILFMLIFWVAIIVLAIWLVARLFPNGKGVSSLMRDQRRDRGSESPEEIVKRRYARGEITKAEYEELLRDLER